MWATRSVPLYKTTMCKMDAISAGGGLQEIDSSVFEGITQNVSALWAKIILILLRNRKCGYETQNKSQIKVLENTHEGRKVGFNSVNHDGYSLSGR